MSILISVIIPTYKPGSYLFECLDSLKSQTFSSKYFEIILVLNGDKEPYLSMIESYRDKNGLLNMKVIYSKEKGVSQARNIALNNSLGNYVAFIDDDDLISPTYLEELYKNSTIDIVALCYPLSFIDNTMDIRPFGITKNYKGDGQLHSLIQTKKFFSGPCYKLIHKRIIGNNRFDKRFIIGEDSLFMFQISKNIKNVAFTTKNAVYYRRFRVNSAITSKRSLGFRINNVMLLLKSYTKIYISDMSHYSFIFYLTRVLGTLKTVFLH